MPHLTRTLSLAAVVLFGVAYMAPIIVLGTFGELAKETRGNVPMAYLAAAVAMFFTALSYSHMAKAYPVAGSAYTYVRRSISNKLGFLAGWVILLDYFFIPMVIWLIGASFLHDAFPSVSLSLWLIAFIVVTTVINVIGLEFAKSVNSLLMIIQILIIAAFVTLSIHYVTTDGTTPLFSLKPFWNEYAHLSYILAGGAVACYSFLGFDAVTTLADETKDPQKTIPRAIILVTLAGSVLFIVTSYFVQLAHPSFVFQHIDSAAMEIAKKIGGDVFVSFFLIGLVVGQFASGVSAQTSASRLLYAMGKDNVIPKNFFGKLNNRFSTPTNNIFLCGVIALIGTQIDVLTAASFINFGAFLAFMFVNLSVINHFWVREKQRSGWQILSYLIFPVIGLGTTFWLFISLDKLAFTLGIIWLCLGIIYLAFLTNMFKKDPPEMQFD
ncbi:APC family permease [Commensalibacter papalotli (ex Botero et al. 2024)]|uniref:Amino acid:H+ symporter family (PotE) (PDB:3LRB) n=1 Tax=Commensalibacter papalotli (ex Botero et al. 2024) TaxID=2972766 RepID=A0ABM9HSV4_9PROT|nr:APC family permease [Commensalibacter papalotli (ex Botero et al. 2024)]CAI3952889.1 Serine transporter YbeC [Commensalibacter papalotli (ex Botero et al. 2024)]CAI3953409.1 Serine transporter YbeC [Commensalibacter papalotli (ex Botero et al. 2024)]